MAENISVSDIIPARPERLFAAWLDPEQHGRMTDGLATDEGDGRFTAWDGYISGRTVSAVPHATIVQAWRTSEFGDEDPDSLLTVRFEPTGEGTKITFDHENIPDGQGEAYLEGWKDFYFTPMKKYFGAPGEKVREVGQKLEAAASDAVKAVKKVQQHARAKLKAVGKQVKALVSRKKPPAKKKVAAKKMAPPKKVAAKKVAAKKVTAKKKAPAKKAPPGKKPARR